MMVTGNCAYNKCFRYNFLWLIYLYILETPAIYKKFVSSVTARDLRGTWHLPPSKTNFWKKFKIVRWFFYSLTEDLGVVDLSLLCVIAFGHPCCCWIGWMSLQQAMIELLMASNNANPLSCLGCNWFPQMSISIKSLIILKNDKVFS